jgi:hypothetical protein
LLLLRLLLLLLLKQNIHGRPHKTGALLLWRLRKTQIVQSPHVSICESIPRN